MVKEEEKAKDLSAVAGGGQLVEKVRWRRRDPLRDGLLRYLGWAPHLAIALQPVGGLAFLPLAHTIRTGYIALSVVSRSLQAAKHSPRRGASLVTGLDTLLWHGAATLAAPGFVMPLVRGLSDGLLYKSPPLNMAVTLLAVFALARPIDRTVDLVLDNSLRLFYDPY